MKLVMIFDDGGRSHVQINLFYFPLEGDIFPGVDDSDDDAINLHSISDHHDGNDDDIISLEDNFYLIALISIVLNLFFG